MDCLGRGVGPLPRQAAAELTSPYQTPGVEVEAKAKATPALSISATDFSGVQPSMSVKPCVALLRSCSSRI